MDVLFKQLRPNAKIPLQASEDAAGYDLYVCMETEEISISPHGTADIPTGLAITPPRGFFGAIFARSGSARKFGIRPAAGVAVFDSDYTGEYIVTVRNDTDFYQTIKNGTRFAQLILLPCYPMNFIKVDELPHTARGCGLCGSTGQD